MPIDPETRKRREDYAAEQWRLAKRNWRWTANILIFLGVIVVFLLWYLYFTLPTG